MKKDHIKAQLKIAVSLLGSLRTDGYGNGKITHSQRNFIAENVIQLLDKTIQNLDQKVVLIIPKNHPNFNPPDELFNRYQPFGLQPIISPYYPCLSFVYIGFTNRVQSPRGLINSSPNLDKFQFSPDQKNSIKT
jgi:hypothetical protein